MVAMLITSVFFGYEQVASSMSNFSAHETAARHKSIKLAVNARHAKLALLAGPGSLNSNDAVAPTAEDIARDQRQTALVHRMRPKSAGRIAHDRSIRSALGAALDRASQI